MGLTIAALGAWYAIARGHRRVGFVVAGAGVAWTLVALLVVVPAFSGGSSRFYGFYDSVGGSPLGMVRTAVTDPLAILGQLFDPNTVVFVLALTAPLAGFFVLAPTLAAVALPQLVMNALADPAGPIDPRQHYLAAMLPFLFAASILGIARLRNDARGTCCADRARALSDHIDHLRAAGWGARDCSALVSGGVELVARCGPRWAVALVPAGAP